jgi:hypothetical protein
MPRTEAKNLADVNPVYWNNEQRAQWITAYLNEKPGILPIPFHDKGTCAFCDLFHLLISLAARQEAKTNEPPRPSS